MSTPASIDGAVRRPARCPSRDTTGSCSATAAAAADGRADPAALRAGVRQRRARRRSRTRRRSASAAITASRRRGSPSRPTRSSSGRSSSPAATSAAWPSTARSTTWRSAAPGRCSCRRRSSSRRGCRSPTCGGSSPRCARRATRRGSPWSPAIPRSSIGARATRSSSPPRIGLVPEGRSLSIRSARPGDRILVSGTIGDHGIAIMSVREGIEFETVLESDTAPLDRPGPRRCSTPAPAIRCMRDPTRGGVSSALNELAEASRRGRQARRGGDPDPPRGPGRLRDARARPALRRQRGEADRRRPAGGRRAARRRSCELTRWDGTPRSSATSWPNIPGMVTLRSLVGGERVVTLLSGEQLPRIC